MNHDSGDSRKKSVKIAHINWDDSECRGCKFFTIDGGCVQGPYDMTVDVNQGVFCNEFQEGKHDSYN
jgi:hypothetical protein